MNIYLDAVEHIAVILHNPDIVDYRPNYDCPGSIFLPLQLKSFLLGQGYDVFEASLILIAPDFI